MHTVSYAISRPSLFSSIIDIVRFILLVCQDFRLNFIWITSLHTNSSSNTAELQRLPLFSMMSSKQSPSTQFPVLSRLRRGSWGMAPPLMCFMENKEIILWITLREKQTILRIFLHFRFGIARSMLLLPPFTFPRKRIYRLCNWP